MTRPSTRCWIVAGVLAQLACAAEAPTPSAGLGEPAQPLLTIQELMNTRVVDTIGILPETYIAVSEAVGIPNNGDLRVIERIRLDKPDVLRDDLESIRICVSTFDPNYPELR